MKHLHVITDLQFGSTGKGLFAGYLGEKLQPDTIVTAWGPNSGHTLIGRDGVKDVNIMLPNALRTANRGLLRVMIGPGSIINPEIMIEELHRFWPQLASIQLMIHEHAAVVTQAHRDAEARYGFGIGSTMKGVGEAVIQKMRRNANEPFPNIAREALPRTELGPYIVSAAMYAEALERANVVLVEGAQGFSLSMNSGFYPYVTSRECTTNQILSDCAIPHNRFWPKVYGVCRTYPIRVANRFDASGKMIGTSGPCYPDQKEIEWASIHREPELTTVTKLPRRLFTFSIQQVTQAVRMNGVGEIFLNFANYISGDRRSPLVAMLRHEIYENAGALVRWIGWGPTINDIEEI